ncbi:MAG: hypothetical protein EP338_11980 [Bacteroidetes bacterium]|nr:MAG: hypothetical protein EP338_11980 [Bacteroidota bacterium]
MKIRFLSKVTPHKRFHFSPRYYDERKERLEHMIERAKADEEVSSEDDQLRRKEMLRQNLSESWGRDRRRAKENTRSNMRVVLIILAILLLGFLIFRQNAKTQKEATIVHQLD